MSGRTSEKLIVHLSYLPPETMTDSDQGPRECDEEWTILRVLPECQSRRIHKRLLCDTCWFLEHVSQCGLDSFVEPLEWDRRGVDPATVVVSGTMTYEECNTSNGHDCDESFDVISMDVLPPEPCHSDTTDEAAR